MTARTRVAVLHFNHWTQKMKKTIEPALSAALAAADIPYSIKLLRNWLITANAGEPEALVRETRAEFRAKVVLLMRDLLSRYPATILGAPVLLLASPDSDSCRKQMAHLSLPFPDADTAQPCADLRFLGWLPTATCLPIALPFRPEHHPAVVPWFKPTAAVAIFRSHAEVFDYDSIALPDLLLRRRLNETRHREIFEARRRCLSRADRAECVSDRTRDAA